MINFNKIWTRMIQRRSMFHWNVISIVTKRRRWMCEDIIIHISNYCGYKNQLLFKTRCDHTYTLFIFKRNMRFLYFSVILQLEVIYDVEFNVLFPCFSNIIVDTNYGHLIALHSIYENNIVMVNYYSQQYSIPLNVKMRLYIKRVITCKTSKAARKNDTV